MADADPQKTFNVHDARTNLADLVDRAHEGEEIVIAKAGEPWARLMPIDDGSRPVRKPGGWPELAAVPESVWFDPLPDDELDFIDDRPEAERH